jgi:hypothetical protein
LNSKALSSKNQEQIIEESKVRPNSDLVPDYVLVQEVEKKKKNLLELQSTQEHKPRTNH